MPNIDIGEPVTATDANSNNTLTYSLSDADSFSIVTRTGQIRTSDPLNFEEKNRYSVTVTVDDGRGGEDSIRVSINVDDVNEAPIGKTIADRTLASGVLSREIDLSSYFSDPDTNDTLRYSASSSDTNVVTTSLSGSMLTLRRASAGSVTITAAAADRPPGDVGRLTVSQEFTVTVETAVPDKPANLKAEPMIGGRGVELKWDAADGAVGYEVEIFPTASTHQIDITGLSAEITGLTPRTIYTFKVIACDPCGTSGLFSLPSDPVDFEAPEPSSFGHPTRRGHQSDHAVMYVIGNIGNSVISDAIMPAVSAWNFAISRLGKGLNICANTDANCVNPDGFTVTIKTVIKNNRAVVFTGKSDEGCGKSRACVKVRKTPGGDHMERIHMIFEDPPWFAQKDKHGKWQHTEFVWTEDKHKNLGIVPCPYDPAYCGTKPTRKYVYVDRVMLHELGHTLGLPEFYNDDATGLKDKLGVMNKSFGILDEDIKQLRAIYLLHNPH